MSAARPRRKGHWLATVLAVLWGFLGVRRRSDYQQDIGRLKPIQIMVVGVVLTFLFVGGLMLLVRWVVG